MHFFWAKHLILKSITVTITTEILCHNLIPIPTDVVFRSCYFKTKWYHFIWSRYFPKGVIATSIGRGLIQSLRLCATQINKLWIGI